MSDENKNIELRIDGHGLCVDVIASYVERDLLSIEKAPEVVHKVQMANEKKHMDIETGKDVCPLIM